MKIVTLFPKVILILLVVLGLIGTSFSLIFSGVMLGIAVVFFLVCLRKIPYRPPYVGLVTIWGRRIPKVKKEGWHLFAPFFPFLYNVTLIKVEKINLDFTFSDIRTKSFGKQDRPRAGGELSVNISLTYFPDYKNKDSGEKLINYINSGGADGVKSIIRDLIEEDIRQLAATKSWEEITFSGEEITKRLVKKLTGEDLTDDLKQELHSNGLPDVVDLGIRISRFNVGKIKEQGELARAAENFAKEEQERRGEQIELDFVKKQIEEYTKIGLSPGEAADVIQAERNKAKKEIKSFRGLDVIAKFLVDKIK